MTKKILSYSTLCILVSSAGLNAATISWNSASSDVNFNTGSNWVGGAVPTASDFARIGDPSATATVSGDADVGSLSTGGPSTLNVNSGVLTVATTAYIGDAGYAGVRQGTMNLNGGRLTVGTILQVGSWNSDSQESTLNVTGGTLNARRFYVGQVSDGTLNISGGNVDLTTNVDYIPLQIGEGNGNGTLTMTGGNLTTNGIKLNADGTGLGTINLDGGTIGINSNFYGDAANNYSNGLLAYGAGANIAIGDGVLQLKGTQKATEMGVFIAEGLVTFATSTLTHSTITASAEHSWTSTDGTTTLYADTNEVTSGYTTFWATSAVPEPSAYALLLGSFLFALVMLRRR